MNEAEIDAIRVSERGTSKVRFQTDCPKLAKPGDKMKQRRNCLHPLPRSSGDLSCERFRPQRYDALKFKVRTSSPRRVDLHPSRKEGPRITVQERKDGRAAVFAALSEPTQCEKYLISWKNLERSPGMPVPGSLKGLRQKGVYLPIFAPKRGTPKKHMGNLQ